MQDGCLNTPGRSMSVKLMPGTVMLAGYYCTLHPACDVCIVHSSMFPCIYIPQYIYIHAYRRAVVRSRSPVLRLAGAGLLDAGCCITAEVDLPPPGRTTACADPCREDTPVNPRAIDVDWCRVPECGACCSGLTHTHSNW